MRKLEAHLIEAAVAGGCLLGGGGGGSMEAGRKIGRLAADAGVPRLASLDELPADAVVATVSAVGAPAAADQFCTPMDYVKALEALSASAGKIDGVVTSENGGLATVNGWFQSAVLGIPVVDAPCNGRAHPMGTMGSIGLHRLDGYVSRQTAVGGNPDRGFRTEISVAAGIVEASRLVRQAAVSAGGMVAVARNPVSAAYLRDHAAPGAITQALELGAAMLAAAERDPASSAEAAAAFLGGEVAAVGTVAEAKLETKGGFDVGEVVVESAGGRLELTFWNEYMTAEAGGKRLATFPDLIATVDAETGCPLPTSAVRSGMRVAVVLVPRSRLILGAGMRDPALLAEAEKIVGKDMVRHVFGGA